MINANPAAPPDRLPGDPAPALARAVLKGEALRELAGRAAWDELLLRYTEHAAELRAVLDGQPPDPRTLDALRQLIALHEELIRQALRARADCMAELAALGLGGRARRAYALAEGGEP